MASTDSQSFSHPAPGVKLLLAAVGIILAAQASSAVPIAGAVALAAWGTALTVARRRGWLVATALVYAVLGVLTVSAQVDLALRGESLAWGLLAGVDAAAAIALLYSLARQTGELLARGLGTRTR